MRTKRIMYLAILMFGICCGMSAQSTKIMVVSDPHVMAPELLVSEGTAWTNYLNGQRKLVDYSKPLFDEMIERIKIAAPALVLISGDLTKDGEQASHKYVISKLDELDAAGIKVLVIPGNHDRGMNSNAVKYDGASTTPVDVADNAWFANEYAKYGYGAGSECEATTLTYACEPIEGLVVIGVDSGTDGKLSSTTLSWVVEKATAARAEGKRVIAMMHHPLIPHVSNAESLVSSYVIDDYDNIRKAFINAGIKVVFTGHFHTSDIAKDYNDDLSKEIYDVNTGSLISYPCDYRDVTMSGDLSEIGIMTGHIAELSPGDGFADIAKDRLHASVTKIVVDKATAIVTAKYGAAMAKMMSSTIENVAKSVADAFIIHAEGNENDVNTDALMTTLSAAFTMMEGSEAMCKSMLYDKAPYGVTDRENVTNDLNLSVELPASVKLAADGYSTYCSENKLDITKTTGLTAFIVSGVTATKVNLKQVNVIPESTGFIVKGTGGTIYDLYKTDAAADDVSKNLLFGTLTATTAPANTYVLSTKGGNTGFFPAKTGIQIPAHKAYLTLGGGSARNISFEEELTAICELESQTVDLSGAFYNIAGQRVTNPTNGMYIVNGKKVIIK